MATCKLCNSTLSGRRDKRFCTAACRSEYHNRRAREHNRMQLEVQRILHKNRNILYQLLVAQGQHIVHRQILMQWGFHFSYFTSCIRLKDQLLFFCYDLYYVPGENDYFALDRSDQLIEHDARDPGLHPHSIR